MFFSDNFRNESNSFQCNRTFNIKDLYLELERKDLIIKNLQSQLLSTQSQSNIINNKQKVENYSKEINLRKLLCQRDQTIKEKENSIQTLQKEISNYNSQLLQKDSVISTLKKEIEEIKIEFKNYNIELNSKDNDIKKCVVEYENKITLLEKENNILQSKTYELTCAINQYSKELKDYSIHLASIESEKNSLASMNKKLTDKNDDCYILIQKYKNEIQSIPYLYNDNISLINELQNAKKELNENHINNNISYKESIAKDEELNQLRTKCENLSQIQKSYDEMNTAYIQLKSSFSQLEINNNINDKRANETEREISALYINTNQIISRLVEWIDNYIGVYNNNNTYNIEDILLSSFNEKLNFNLLYDCLNKKRSTINNIIEKYEKIIKDNNIQLRKLSNELNSMQNDYDNSNRELLYQKNNLIYVEKEIFTMKKNINDKDKEIEQLKYKNDIYNKNIVEYDESIGNLVQNLINGIINNANVAKFFNVTEQNKANFDNKLDFILFSLNNIMKFTTAISKEYESLISNNTKEIQKTNSETEQSKLSVSDNEENQKLKFTLKKYEKKLNNIQTELDLKDIQIKSQEQIIQKKSQRENSISNNSYEEGIFKGLERDKQKLINDNMLLIKENKLLKEQLDKLTKEIKPTGEKK